MKGIPDQKTRTEIKERIAEAGRTYVDAKQELYENTVTRIEKQTSPLVAVLFVGLLISVWLIAIFGEMTIALLWNGFGFVPVTIVFLIAYFAFFHLSKLVTTPSVDELNDDTSYFALFSACEARERRGLRSAAFGVANVVGVILCMFIREPGLGAIRLF